MRNLAQANSCLTPHKPLTPIRILSAPTLLRLPHMEAVKPAAGGRDRRLKAESQFWLRRKIHPVQSCKHGCFVVGVKPFSRPLSSQLQQHILRFNSFIGRGNYKVTGKCKPFGFTTSAFICTQACDAQTKKCGTRPVLPGTWIRCTACESRSYPLIRGPSNQKCFAIFSWLGPSRKLTGKKSQTQSCLYRTGDPHVAFSNHCLRM